MIKASKSNETISYIKSYWNITKCTNVLIHFELILMIRADFTENNSLNGISKFIDQLCQDKTDDDTNFLPIGLKNPV